MIIVIKRLTGFYEVLLSFSYIVQLSSVTFRHVVNNFVYVNTEDEYTDRTKNSKSAN